MDDFAYNNVDDFFAHARRKYGNEFVRRNKPILRVMFSDSRGLTYTEEEYIRLQHRIVVYAGTTGNNVEMQGCIGVTNYV
jgi:hypothetical protein